MAAASLPLVDAAAVPTSSAASWARSDNDPVIRIDASRRNHQVHLDLLGVNSRWFRDGDGAWNAAAGAPIRAVVNRTRRAGIQSLRYPGGTVATMFEWKKAVGDSRGCQINGHGNRASGYGAAKRSRAYGPTEFMTLIRAIRGTPIIMAPVVRNLPRDSADWVEYMNARVGANPNGGFDWATVRAADGHRAPYNVRRWEVGNEAQAGPYRYGYSSVPYRAVRQYANGGARHVKGEALGKGCYHRSDGVPSNGRRNQVFSVLYKPFERSNFSVKVNGVTWKRVKDLSQHGADARVYTTRPQAGEVIFGDGRHGLIPPEGATVRATYINRYPGFFKYARAMKAVDRDIKVCATWGAPNFARVAGDRRYDCLTSHPTTNFRMTGTDRWKGPLEGHDRMMLGLGDRLEEMIKLRRSLPARTRYWLTEFNAIFGDYQAFPNWSASASHAMYMASMYVMLLKLGMPWANGGDYMTWGYGAVLGPAPHYTFSSEAMVREALLPLFKAGGRVVRSEVRNNPLRTPALGAGSYSALNATATRRGDQMWVIVVNRLPGQPVQAKIRFSGFNSRSKALVRRVSSQRFASWNRPGRPAAVRLRTSTRTVGRSEFAASFPPHSLTVFRLTRR